MNALRSILFVLWMYGLMLVIGLIWLPALLLAPSVTVLGIRIYARLVRFGLRWICGVRTEIRGLENLPARPVIYAAKHQCMWDVFIPFLVLDSPVVILKRELLRYPIFGWYARKGRMIPIDRAGTTRTIRRMSEEAANRVAAGRSVVIFPEGTRHRPGVTTGYFSAGTGALYKALEIPVIPVATNSGLNWPAHGFIRRPGVAVFEILPALPSGLDRRELMAQLEASIEPASARLLDEGLAVQGRNRRDLETV